MGIQFGIDFVVNSRGASKRHPTATDLLPWREDIADQALDGTSQPTSDRPGQGVFLMRGQRGSLRSAFRSDMERLTAVQLIITLCCLGRSVCKSQCPCLWTDGRCGHVSQRSCGDHPLHKLLDLPTHHAKEAGLQHDLHRLGGYYHGHARFGPAVDVLCASANTSSHTTHIITIPCSLPDVIQRCRVGPDHH